MHNRGTKPITLHAEGLPRASARTSVKTNKISWGNHSELNKKSFSYLPCFGAGHCKIEFNRTS